MSVPEYRILRLAIVADDTGVLAQFLTQLSEHSFLSEFYSYDQAGPPRPSDNDLLVFVDPPTSQRVLLEIDRDYPILVLLSVDHPLTRASWLDIGADDCLSFPMHAAELRARIQALARRTKSLGRANSNLTNGKLELRPRERQAYLRGRRLKLTSLEYDLLEIFIRSAGHVLSRERLLELTRGAADESFERAIDVQISRLRNKLGDDPRDPELLKTVRGRGYVFQAS